MPVVNVDTFVNQAPQLNSPASNAAVVTPSDADDLAFASRYIFVGSAGNLALTTVGGQTLTLVGILAGTILPIRAKKILSTGTTPAMVIVSMY